MQQQETSECLPGGVDVSSRRSGDKLTVTGKQLVISRSSSTM